MKAAREAAEKREGFIIKETDEARLGLVNFGFESAGDSAGEAMDTDAGPIPDVAVIQIFDDAELAVLRLELRQAIDHMPEFKAPTNLYNTAGVCQDSLYDDDEQLLVGGGFAALANPGSFHNHFVRRLRRKVQEKLLRDDVFGLEYPRSDGRRSAHADMLIEQVIDRMLVRRPGSEPQAESWHRDVARGTCSGDKVYGGWLNLDPPLGADPKPGDYQYFSCVPKSASDPGANENAGFATDAPSAERIKDGSHKVRIPPGWLVIFNELTLHEVLSTQAKRRMSRVFFGWRLSRPEHHFLPERYVDPTLQGEEKAERILKFKFMKSVVKDSKTSDEDIAYQHSIFDPMKCRYPMMPDLVTRFLRQEGMPLKSGQHPERKNKLTEQKGPMRCPENHDTENRYGQPNMDHYKTDGGGVGQIQPGKHFEYYPQGPPNWPHLWASTNDPRTGLLKYSYGAIERVIVRSEDGARTGEGRNGVLSMPLRTSNFLKQWDAARYTTKNPRTAAVAEEDKLDNKHIWGDHMPMLTLSWNGGKLGNRWPNGVVGVPQTFMGLKDYERMQREGDIVTVLDGSTADGRMVAYVDYVKSEVMLHFPLTAREAKHYLGMEGTEAIRRYQYHNAKPFVHEPDKYLAGFNRAAPFDDVGGDALMTAPPAGKVRNPLPAPTHLQQYLHARGGELRPLLEIMANADAFVAEDDPDYPEALKNYEAFTDVSGDTNFPGTVMV